MCTATDTPTYRVGPAPRRRLVARCGACPWVSEPVNSGGMAGAKFDKHKEEDHS